MDVKTVLEKDAIPSIDEPEFGDEFIGDPEDDVLVVDGDPVKAYPIRILNFHEIVNDTVDGRPLAITWCPLCASAVVYERHVQGQELTFGVSGKLADDDLVMYDRETGSEWKQSLGQCIAGEFDGTALTVVPANLVPYEAFVEGYPDGVVLQPPHLESEAASDTDDPAPVEYEDDPYEEYFEMDEFGLAAHRDGDGRSWDRDDLHPKTIVLGVETADAVRAYPEPVIERAGGVVRDDLGPTSLIVVSTDTGLHAFEDPGFDLTWRGDGLAGDGTTWEPVTGESGDGRSLTRLPSRRLFAFTWQDDHGAEAFYLGDE